MYSCRICRFPHSLSSNAQDLCESCERHLAHHCLPPHARSRSLALADQAAGISERHTYWHFTNSGAVYFKEWKASGSLSLEKRLLTPLKLNPPLLTHDWVIAPILRSLPRLLAHQRDPVLTLLDELRVLTRTDTRRVVPLHSGHHSPQHQALRTRSERLEFTFSVSTEYRKRLRSKALLLDDLWTTGATLRAAAHSLQLLGVQEIRVLTLGERIFSEAHPLAAQATTDLAAFRDESDPRSPETTALHP